MQTIEHRDFDAEAEALRRAEAGQVKLLLLAWAAVENAVGVARLVLAPLRSKEAGDGPATS
jgi:hypothetical protein